MRRLVSIRTLCGCERVVEWREPLPPEIRMPLRVVSAIPEPPPEEWTKPIPVRVFRARGLYGGIPCYLETGLALVDAPEAPRLVREEWADAVSRFMDWQNGAFGAEWAKVREDFCKRHDGATMIAHAKSGALIGAFYPAPQWENADEAVKLFRMLSLLGGSE